MLVFQAVISGAAYLLALVIASIAVSAFITGINPFKVLGSLNYMVGFPAYGLATLCFGASYVLSPIYWVPMFLLGTACLAVIMLEWRSRQ